MYETVNFSSFCDAFRSVRPENFSYDGLRLLFNYLELMEEDTGEKIELDVIALCSEYTESTVKEALESYDLETLEELKQNTTVLKIDDERIVYQAY